MAAAENVRYKACLTYCHSPEYNKASSFFSSLIFCMLCFSSGLASMFSQTPVYVCTTTVDQCFLGLPFSFNHLEPTQRDCLGLFPP